MPAPAEILALIERFTAQRAEFERPDYNETQARVDFINPLFRALGWDMENADGLPPSQRDVVHEDAVRIGDHVKAPDYAFRVGGARKFFVEAKKPAHNLKKDAKPAYQLRRYGWSATLTLSILTDFAEFAVYDCRVKPSDKDAATVARVHYFTCEQYAEKWDEIAALFSREAVLSGALDRFAEQPAPRGAMTVDAAFLADLDLWRRDLAKRIWQLNRKQTLTHADINYAVQKILDRIIFLRICEDRGVEDYARLFALVNGVHVYDRLTEYFKQARDRYNSGLFYFPPPERDHAEQPDRLTPTLHVDDETLSDILKKLYFPLSPYVFSEIPVEILGQAYEQFLGKVIRVEVKAGSPEIVIEPKPEVRKAGGVYYTPAYIVEYIVSQTLTPLLHGKTPKQAAKLRVLDPACGSGSFLIGAYQFLLDWYLRAYSADSPEKHAKAGLLRQTTTVNGAEWRLTIKARKQILLDNLYGVDIDSRAVETTKLSLLLRALEGETDETIRQQRQLWHERALPDLGRNIQCGNALIAPDFEAFATTRGWQLGAEDYARINYFDWQHAFAPIFAEGGFDAVIGNPPYIRIQAMQAFAPHELPYYKHTYPSAAQGNCDIYLMFVEKGLSLLKAHGTLGYILPHKFFNAQYGEPLRAALAAGKHLRQVVHFGDQQIFKGATTYTCLLFLGKAAQPTFEVARVNDLIAWRTGSTAERGSLSAESLNAKEWHFSLGAQSALFERLKAMPVKLGDVANIFVGLQTSADTVFVFKEYEHLDSRTMRVFSKSLMQWVDLEAELLRPVVRSGGIGRYNATVSAYVLFPYYKVDSTFRLITEADLAQRYPRIWRYLNGNQDILTSREHGKFRETGWYQLYPKNLDLWEQPKIMLPYMVSRLCAYFDLNYWYFVNVTTGGFGITARNQSKELLPYLTALLNSGILDWFFKKISPNFRSGYFGANKQYLAQLPIRLINFDDPAERALHDQIVATVQTLLGLHQQLAGAASPATRTPLERRISELERQLDEWVYQLYGLSAAEIALIEG